MTPCVGRAPQYPPRASRTSHSGKQTKPIWLIILGVATVIGLGSLAYSVQLVSLFPIIAFVAAAIYLADVRPKVKEFRSDGRSSGPYGPW